MQFSYDPQYNIACLRQRPKSSGVESVKISDEFLLMGRGIGTNVESSLKSNPAWPDNGGIK
jgi:hypothetical protein